LRILRVSSSVSPVRCWMRRASSRRVYTTVAATSSPPVVVSGSGSWAQRRIRVARPSPARDSRSAGSAPTSTALVRACASLPVAQPRDVATATAYTLRCLAQRIAQLTTQARDLERQITAVITTHAPQLLHRRGVGPDSAAALLITAGDNPDRLRSDASFAALCGVSPIQASSGKTTRHRLNRGGDRQANAALYRIAFTRLRCDPRTRSYLARRTTQGKTRREAIRCIKRYLAREIYRLLQPLTPQAGTTPRAG